jgi:hypothetical protein
MPLSAEIIVPVRIGRHFLKVVFLRLPMPTKMKSGTTTTVRNRYVLHIILCFHFYLAVKITTRNSKTGTFTTLKLFQMYFCTQSGVKFPL